MFPVTYYMWGCLFAVAATTTRYKISGRVVAVDGGVHVGVVFATTVLCTSLVKSATWFRRWALSSLSWSRNLFVCSAWTLIRVIILEVSIVSIFRVIILSKAVD